MFSSLHHGRGFEILQLPRLKQNLRFLFHAITGPRLLTKKKQMNFIITVLSLACLCPVVAFPQAMPEPGSPFISFTPVTPGFGNALVCFTNPAAIAHVRGFSAALFCERRYMLKNLNLLALAATYTRSRRGAGVSVRRFGNSAYSYTSVSINYGMSLGQVALGSDMSYRCVRTRGTASRCALSYGMGSVCSIMEGLYVNVMVQNPVRFTAGDIAGSAFHTGLSYRVSSELCVDLKWEKTGSAVAGFSAGILYRFNESVFSQAGYSSAGDQPFVSIGWARSYFRLLITVTYHSVLGASPGTVVAHSPAFVNEE